MIGITPWPKLPRVTLQYILTDLYSNQKTIPSPLNLRPPLLPDTFLYSASSHQGHAHLYTPSTAFYALYILLVQLVHDECYPLPVSDLILWHVVYAYYTNTNASAWSNTEYKTLGASGGGVCLYTAHLPSLWVCRCIPTLICGGVRSVCNWNNNMELSSQLAHFSCVMLNLTTPSTFSI